MDSHGAIIPATALELALLRLDSPVWLLRAASTCKRWLRVVASAGFYHNRNLFLRPRFDPSPSAAAAGVDAGRFSLDFLPGGDVSNWRILGSRGVSTSSGDGGGMWRGTSIGAVAGRQYYHNGDKKVVVLDEGALEFSAFVLPDGERWHRHFMKVTLTAARDGEARIVVAGGCTTLEDFALAAGGSCLESFSEFAEAVGVHTTLKVFARVGRAGGNSNGNSEVWELEKTIHLSPAMFGLPRLARFYLRWHLPIVMGTVQMWVPTAGNFRLDIETLEVERLPESSVGLVSTAYPCELPWPPSLQASSPSA
ncbi:unnamed protein product [Urochloa humidicola]